MNSEVLMLTRLFQPHRGGVETHVYKLSEELFKRGIKTNIITEQFDRTLADCEDYDFGKIYRISYPYLSSKKMTWKWMLKKKSLINRYDVIHIHDVFWWFLPYINKNYFMTYHGYEGSYPPNTNAIIQRKLGEILSKESICIGSFMRKWYYASTQNISYGAADVFNHDIKKIKNNRAVFYGRFSEDTGLIEYLESMQLFNTRLSLSVYGSGPQNKIVESKAKKLGIKVYPWSNEILKLLKKNQYAFVSRYLSILEAMQAKRLVLAVYNNEIKKDYLMCHPMSKNMIIAGSAKELATKFNSLTEAQEHIMIDNAYAWAKEQTWEKLANQYLDLWGLTQ
jgi:glycosyltransferase involved in cell wall biosynthesis